MAFISLNLSEKPHSGSSNEATHKYILRCTGQSDLQVYQWLTRTQEESGTSVSVERPDGSMVSTGYPIILSYDNLVLNDISYKLEKDRDPELYRITAKYRNDDGSGGGASRPPDDPESETDATLTFGLEYAVSNDVYKTSLATTDSWGVKFTPAEGGDVFWLPPAMNQAINVQLDGSVQGTAAPEPEYIETVTVRGAAGFFTDAKRAEIASLVGKVNLYEFRTTGLNFPAGEVRFLGAAGDINNAGESTITFRFGIRRNQTDLQIDSIDTDGHPIDVLGWEYFWVLYGKDLDDEGKVITRPRGAYREKLFEYADLDAMLLTYAAWQAATPYTLGDRVMSGSQAYQAEETGTSGGTAPTGTGTGISDGGITWFSIL